MRPVAMCSHAIARALLLLGLSALTVDAAGAKEAEARIVLKDGRTIVGRLRALQESRYLVQGAEGGEQVVLELPAAQIQSVDGRAALPAYDPQQPVRVTQAVEEVDAGGAVTSWFTMEVRNESRSLMTRVSWGVADWERERSSRLRVLDPFGHQLTPRLEPRGEGQQVIIDLAVPVAPLETLVLSVGYHDEGLARREGDHWVYTFSGDYPDDRLLSRTVLLPAGATVIGADPQPSAQLDHERAPFVFWRRYYAAGERLPLTVRYRLP